MITFFMKIYSDCCTVSLLSGMLETAFQHFRATSHAHLENCTYDAYLTPEGTKKQTYLQPYQNVPAASNFALYRQSFAICLTLEFTRNFQADRQTQSLLLQIILTGLSIC